jgi:hypothetical protein
MRQLCSVTSDLYEIIPTISVLFGYPITTMTSSRRSSLIRCRPRFRIQRQITFFAVICVSNFSSWVVLGFSSLRTAASGTQLRSSEDSGNGSIGAGDDDDGGGLICAAVLVPGFLTGAAEFEPMCRALAARGLPTVSIGMPNWHWLPCLGGRSARPILERIDFTVKHLIANDGDVTKIPPYEYSLVDTWRDFRNNPGGVFRVGGSSKVEDYPVVEPQGRFPLPESIPRKKVALIGHRYVVVGRLAPVPELGVCVCGRFCFPFLINVRLSFWSP